jgi:hypothetical protein
MIRQEDLRFVMGRGSCRKSMLDVRSFPEEQEMRGIPEGIPPEVYSMKVFHNKQYPGDNGIVFKPLPEFDTSHVTDL